MISDFAYILRHRLPGLFCLLGLGSVGAFLLAFVDPIAMKLLIDEGLGQKNLKLFVIVCLAVVSLAGVLSLLKFLEALLAQRLKNDLAAKLCARMLTAFYRLPYRQISAEGEGYFISRVYEEPRKAVDLVVGLVQETLIRLITIITALGISLYLSWRVTAVLAGTVPVLYWLSRKFGGRIMRESKLENEAEASFRHGLARGLGAYITVRSFGLESQMMEGAMSSLGGFFSALYRRVKSTWIFRTASSVSMAMAESAVLIVAAVDVFLGHMTIGGMLAYMSGFWKLMNAAADLIEQLPEFSRAHGYITRLREFEVDARLTVEAVSSQVVELRSISFGYTNERLFNQLDLTIAPGERMLLLGRNGCGKTSLGLILSGYLTIDSRHEGISLPIPQRVSAMLSPLTFFLGTLREHLQWDVLSPEQRVLAERMLLDFHLTDKLDSDPQSFSEGEKRKAYLIMCLLKDADLYILDEPLMAVEENSKKLVMDWIFRWSEGRMLLVIMHGDLQFHGRFQRIIELSEQRTIATALSEALNNQP